jgi:hypothetical protein
MNGKLISALLAVSSILLISGAVSNGSGQPLFFFGAVGLVGALGWILSHEHNLKSGAKTQNPDIGDVIAREIRQIRIFAWIAMAWVFALFGACFLWLSLTMEHKVSGTAVTIIFALGAANAIYQAIATRRDKVIR